MIGVNNWIVIPLTFLVALMLMLLPMPDWAVWFRPAWVLLVLIYWNIVLPYRVSVGTAWLLGMMLDVIHGTTLGEHAFALTVVSLVVVRMHARLHMFPLLQQGLAVFFLVIFYEFIVYCIRGFVGDLPRGWLYWSPALTSMLIWPWIYTMLRDCRRRFKVA
jgi:rod shape-determining protein MreD